MLARRTAVVVSAVALLLTGGPLGVSTPGVSPPAAAEDGSGAAVFVNEIHYANAGVDAGEFVEIAGPSGTDLTGYEVVLYDARQASRTPATPLTATLPAQRRHRRRLPRSRACRTVRVRWHSSTADRVVELLSWGGEITPATDRRTD